MQAAYNASLFLFPLILLLFLQTDTKVVRARLI